MEETSALIIDSGTNTIKAGFAGNDDPLVVFPTIVGRPKYHSFVNNKGLEDVFIGDNTECKRGIIITSNPIKAGCSSMYPTHPLLGVGVYMLKMFASTPPTPPELKNVTKIFYTKYFLTKLDPGNVYLIQ